MRSHPFYLYVFLFTTIGDNATITKQETDTKGRILGGSIYE